MLGLAVVSVGHLIIIGMALRSNISRQTYKDESFSVEVFWLEDWMLEVQGVRLFNSTREAGLNHRVGDWAVYFFKDAHPGCLG